MPPKHRFRRACADVLHHFMRHNEDCHNGPSKLLPLKTPRVETSQGQLELKLSPYFSVSAYFFALSVPLIGSQSNFKRFATLYIPNILPEELLHGYWKRIALHASIYSQIDGRRMIARYFTGQNAAPSPADLLSRMTGKPFEELVMKHSLLPLRATFDSERLNTDVTTKSGIAFWISLGKFPNSRPRICPHCTISDLELHGFSYWRRHHLIGGIRFCRNHPGQDLIAFELDVDEIDSSDTSALYAACESMRTIIPGEIELKFANICWELLDIGRPLIKKADMFGLVSKKSPYAGKKKKQVRREFSQMLDCYLKDAQLTNWLNTEFSLGDDFRLSRFLKRSLAMTSNFEECLLAQLLISNGIFSEIAPKHSLTISVFDCK